MTLSIRNALRSLSLLALTAAFVPGCDGEEYEALGFSSEEIDAMSEQELDELAVDAKVLTSPLPDPTGRPVDLTTRPADPGHTRYDGPDALWAPYHTHTEAPETIEGIAHPVHPTHGTPAIVGPLGLPDPGCTPEPELPQLANG